MARCDSRMSIADDGSDFFAPAKTPDAVVAKLNADINQILRQPPVQQRLKSIGFDPIFKPHAEAAAYFESEIASWGKMVGAIGLSVD